MHSLIPLKKPYGSNYSCLSHRFCCLPRFQFFVTTKVPVLLPTQTLFHLEPNISMSITILSVNTLMMALSLLLGSLHPTWPLIFLLNHSHQSSFSIIAIILDLLPLNLFSFFSFFPFSFFLSTHFLPKSFFFFFQHLSLRGCVGTRSYFQDRFPSRDHTYLYI